MPMTVDKPIPSEIENITSTYSIYTDINSLVEILKEPSTIINYLPLINVGHDSNVGSIDDICNKASKGNYFNLRLFSGVRILVNTTEVVKQSNALKSILSIDFPKEMLDNHNYVILNYTSTRVIDQSDLSSQKYMVYKATDLLSYMLSTKIKYDSLTYKRAHHNIKNLKRLLNVIRSLNINIGLIPESGIATLRILSKASLRSIRHKSYIKSFVVPKYVLNQYGIQIPKDQSSEIELPQLTVYSIVKGKLTLTSMTYSSDEGFKEVEIPSTNDIATSGSDTEEKSSISTSNVADDLSTKNTTTTAITTIDNSNLSIQHNTTQSYEVSYVEYVDTSISTKFATDSLIAVGEQYYDILVQSIEGKITADLYSNAISELNKLANKINQLYRSNELTYTTLSNFFDEYAEEYNRLSLEQNNYFKRNAEVVKQILTSLPSSSYNSKRIPVQLGATDDQIIQLIGYSKSSLRDSFVEAMKYIPTSWISKIISLHKNKKLTLRSVHKRGEFKNNSDKYVIKAKANSLSVLLHEFCHYLGSVITNITKLEKDYYLRRTQHRPTFNIPGYRRSELFRKSTFVEPYMGKLYDHNSFEIISTGYSFLFTQPDRVIKDKDLTCWLLGLIICLGNTDLISDKDDSDRLPINRDKSTSITPISLDKAIRPLNTNNHIYNSMIKIIQQYTNSYSLSIVNVSMINTSDVDDSMLRFSVIHSDKSVSTYEVQFDNDPLYVSANNTLMTLSDLIDTIVSSDSNINHTTYKSLDFVEVRNKFYEILYHSIEEDFKVSLKDYLNHYLQFNSSSVYDDYNKFVFQAYRSADQYNKDYYESVDYNNRYDEFEFVYVLEVSPIRYVKIIINPCLMRETNLAYMYRHSYDSDERSFELTTFNVFKTNLIDVVRLELPN